MLSKSIYRDERGRYKNMKVQIEYLVTQANSENSRRWIITYKLPTSWKSHFPWVFVKIVITFKLFQLAIIFKKS